MKDFVGVIDSGVGGLTILKQLTQNNGGNFLYVADHAYCPYGTKSSEVVLRRVSTIIGFLIEAGASAIVIACNTASCFAEALSHKFLLPIYNVITPTCREVIAATNSKRVALLATNGTINSRSYHKLLEPSGITVCDFPCSSFVPFIEQNSTSSISCYQAVDKALRDLPQANVDTVILGCTHFPLLRSHIEYYCRNAQIVECCCDLPSTVNNSNVAPHTVEYLTTGNTDFANVAAKWYGDVHFKHISL